MIMVSADLFYKNAGVKVLIQIKIFYFFFRAQFETFGKVLALMLLQPYTIYNSLIDYNET